MLKDPFSTGSLVPSSPYLAKAMTDASDGAEWVLELGAGTGAITKALIHRHGLAAVRAVEQSAPLATALGGRFPGLDVVQGCAQDVLAGIPAECSGSLALVSSLPFRSLPSAVAREIQEGITGALLLRPKAWLVQYTYQPRQPFAAPSGFSWKQVASVWRNFPPAGVWVLRKRG
jgi:phosphatidylethanolamine/phosphatidyl-N-methylethanolamine N-methyltransferase